MQTCNIILTFKIKLQNIKTNYIIFLFFSIDLLISFLKQLNLHKSVRNNGIVWSIYIIAKAKHTMHDHFDS